MKAAAKDSENISIPSTRYIDSNKKIDSSSIGLTYQARQSSRANQSPPPKDTEKALVDKKSKDRC
jgi:hypothetical protein